MNDYDETGSTMAKLYKMFKLCIFTILKSIGKALRSGNVSDRNTLAKCS